MFCRWRLWERQLRSVVCWVVFFCMIAFYLPVVTAIQALLQVGHALLTTALGLLGKPEVPTMDARAAA